MRSIYSYFILMPNSVIMPVRVHNETEYKDANVRLKSIYREIMKLVIKKEEIEDLQAKLEKLKGDL